MQRTPLLMMGLLLALPTAAVAQQTAATHAGPPSPIHDEAPVVVEGWQPGPGLWLVRSADGQHAMYILGTLSPLPAKMQWQSKQVDQVIASAQEVIRSPVVKFDVKTGWFKSLLLLPKLLGVRKNPDDKTLQDVVSPASYARWLVLKARYIGHDSGVEKWRPLFAVQKLYGEAMQESKLDNAKSVWPVIADAIEKYHPTVTSVQESIVVTDPKPLLKEFSKTTLDDLACFDDTMTRIETDIDTMRARANAWATGDIAQLRALPPAYRWEACSSAFTEAGIGKRLGFGDAQHKVEAKWFAAADAALSHNAVTFATLPLTRMLADDGYLAKLRAKGYTVIGPDE